MFERLKSFDYPIELIERVFKLKTAPLVANIVSPLFIIFILQNYISLQYAVIYLSLQAALLIWRMHIAQKGLKLLHKSDKKKLHTLLKHYIYSIIANAFLLALTLFPALIYAEELHVFMIGATLFALITGSISTLTPIYHAIFAFIFVLISTFAAILLFLGNEPIYFFIAVLSIIYLIVSLPTTLKIHLALRDSIQQKEEVNKLNNMLEANIIELKEKNNSFQNLLDITMEAILIIDDNLKIIDVNQSGITLLKSETKETLIGSSIFDFIAEHELETLKESFKSEKKEPYEMYMKKCNGEIFPALTSGKNITMHNKTVRISTIMDLTQIKQKDQLLVQQSRLAAMGEMIGNIAHQWRQPLNALGLVLQNIHFEYQMGTLSDEQMERSVEKGKKLTQSMSQTIDDFRNFFKPNKRKEHFKIADVIHGTLELIGASYQNHNINLEFDIDDSLKLKGYPNELSQVILNILSNAKDAFMTNGIKNKKLKIRTYQNVQHIIIEIADTAGGIPEQIINQIFEPYFTTKEEGKGTGIGLYMSKMIIENNMGGQIFVQNNQAGAIFTILFDNTLFNKPYHGDSICI